MVIFRTIKKLKYILFDHSKARIVQLIVLMIAGGLLETLSASLILPFMNIAMNPDESMDNQFVSFLCSICDIRSPRTLLVFLSLILAFLYIFKNSYLMFEYNIQYRFVYKNLFNLKKRIVDSIIYSPYEGFLNLNSGELIRIINTDANMAFNSLTTILVMFSEFVVSIMLLGAVFIIAPTITLIVAVVMFLLLTLVYLFIRPTIRKYAFEDQSSKAGANKWFLQSVNGIKDIKVMKREKFFFEKYCFYANKSVRATRIYQTLVLVPRFFVEAMCMASLFIVVGVMIYRGVELNSIIPSLTTVAMASIRLLPSVNRMANALGALSFDEPFLDKTIECINSLSTEKNGLNIKMVSDNAVEVPVLKNEIMFRNVSYSYPGTEKCVLLDVDFIIKKGESVGIVGPSGAGKSTTIDILLGLLPVKKGQILVDGVDIYNNISDWINQIGYIPQTIFLLDDTIRSNVAFGIDKSNVDDADVWKALEEAALDDFVKSLPNGLDTEVGERGVRLSGGQRQRIGIARAMYRKPEILIFDEATSSLDVDTEEIIMESIGKLQGTKTIIIIAHRLSTIEKCDHIYRVEGGTVKLER